MSKNNPKMFEFNGKRLNFQHDNLTSYLMPDSMDSERLNFILVTFLKIATEIDRFGIDSETTLDILCNHFDAKPSSVIQTVIAWYHGMNSNQDLRKNFGPISKLASQD